MRGRDFCYYTNFLCLVALVYPSTALRQLVFLYAMGPLAWAIAAWRNSLVFHSIDKITSVFIHAFPGLLAFSWRWSLKDAETGRSSLCDNDACTLPFVNTLGPPILG
jgi:hypothetical protein